jgi:serine/threonine protein kinase
LAQRLIALSQLQVDRAQNDGAGRVGRVGGYGGLASVHSRVMRKSASDALIGRTIANKFVIESLLGSGAMGAVYRARQTALDKIVAIKVLHGEHADDAQFAARFQREAKAASRLNHPNSMTVIDYGEEPDGLLYIAMEYLDGENLLGLLKRDFPLAPARTADLLMQTLAALAVAHDMGVVHRDLKPENIMVLHGTDDDGNPADVVKVCDFGIAKITDSRAYKRDGSDRVSEAPVTTAGFLVGTPEYMSPEQGKGEKLDSRSDLYSVGVILYQLLTNVVPFDAENAIGVVLTHITEEPERPSLVNPGADRRLEAVCLRALRKVPADRYQTAREMRGDLRAAIDGSRGTPTSTPAPLPASANIRVAVRDSAPASEHAATLELSAAAVSQRRAVVDSQSKPTLTGTSAPVARAPRRGRTAVLMAAVIATIAGIGSYAAFDRFRRHAGEEVDLAHDLPIGSIGATPSGSAKLGSIRSDDSSRGPSNGSPSGSHRPLLPIASHSGAAPSASAPVASAVPLASATDAPSASTTPAVSAAPSASSSAAAPTPSASAAPDPFDADKAFVVVGLISANGAQESGVRAALRGVNFSGCYKAALKRTGVRAAGQASLSLSIDADGHVRSAILQPSFALPTDASRCIQSSAASISVAKAQIDGAGTAQIYLDFRIP